MKKANTIYFDNIFTYRVVPIPLLFISPTLIAIDIYLTWLASPDLKYEANILINILNLGWLEIIVLSATYALVIIVLALKANNYFYQRSKHSKGFQFYANLFYVMVFYSQVFSSVFCILNNLLGYVYLFNTSYDVLNQLAISYVSFYQKIISWYLIAAYTCLIVIGIIVSIIRIRKTNHI